MPKDRDQLTPDDPEDAAKIHPHRSAAIEAEDTNDAELGHGPASGGSDPTARSEVSGDEKDNYK
jgi:hypothetical protein